MTNVIFLDIDGVLNSEQWYESICNGLIQPIHDNHPYTAFDPKSIEILNEITDATNSYIVLSTSWSFDENLIELLNYVGVAGEIIGRPEYLISNKGEISEHLPRGNEIQH